MKLLSPVLISAMLLSVGAGAWAREGKDICKKLAGHSLYEYITCVPLVQNRADIYIHNDSLISLETNEGHRWQFRYVYPSPSMKERGARKGDTLIEGWAEDGKISATAYLFSKGCGTFAYKINGTYDNSLSLFTMKGQAPVIDRSKCKITKVLDDKMIIRKYFIQ